MRADEIQYPSQLCYPELVKGMLFWIFKRNVRVGYVTDLDLEKARYWTPEWPELTQGAILYFARGRTARVLRHDSILGWYVIAYDGLAVRWWLFKERAKRIAERLKVRIGQAAQLFGGKLEGDCTYEQPTVVA